MIHFNYFKIRINLDSKNVCKITNDIITIGIVTANIVTVHRKKTDKQKLTKFLLFAFLQYIHNIHTYTLGYWQEYTTVTVRRHDHVILLAI